MNVTFPVHAALLSVTGCVRENNEDAFFFQGDYPLLSDMNGGTAVDHSFRTDTPLLFAICDGMGGAQLGERASSLTAQSLENLLSEMESTPDGDTAAMMLRSAEEANRLLLSDFQCRKADSCGTTLCMAALRGDHLDVLNVGDSRAYLLSSGELRQLTEDHSLVWTMMRNGLMTKEDARKSPRSNVITRHIGMRVPYDGPIGDHYEETLKNGDRLLLCSDGLSDMLPDRHIARIMNKAISPMQCARMLVLDALEKGGRDNITCMVINIGRFRALKG